MAEDRWGRPSLEATGEGAAEAKAVIADLTTTMDSTSPEDAVPAEAEVWMEAAGQEEAADPTVAAGLSAVAGPTGAAAAAHGEYVDDIEETGTVPYRFLLVNCSRLFIQISTTDGNRYYTVPSLNVHCFFLSYRSY
jgi:hypothetical protein